MRGAVIYGFLRLRAYMIPGRHEMYRLCIKALTYGESVPVMVRIAFRTVRRNAQCNTQWIVRPPVGCGCEMALHLPSCCAPNSAALAFLSLVVERLSSSLIVFAGS